MVAIYILRCADGTYYIGHSEDVGARVVAHNAGSGARYTSLRRPVELVYVESHPTMTAALKREAQLKRWSAVKKAALVAGRPSTLKDLPKCRSAR
jgi:predicted GIY-YIG superfamily endonuclease